ncbi:exosortase A [Qipengyuania qiaonensis]|uniref:Exosortase A n=1 Tax=Qipengyuania qiaonensis TaxID=2867240 RepID=A0ABS7J5K7_9SPHN|nr:exosortase A [Qipengyuania qiaonensis]MBX7481154.1 exosortase A [Qipengyuania qiaonensis]
MQPEGIVMDRPATGWGRALIILATAWFALFWMTLPEWSEMAHQWWNIDTYSHILLIPPIVAWLVWIKRDELVKVEPGGWGPGLIWMGLGLAVWYGGRIADVNLVAQAGTIALFQGSVLAILGLRVSLILAFPLAYVIFLVPFGDEVIPQLQYVTAEMATAFTRWSGIETVADGIHIDTPAGLFIVAEECSGVKFLIAMVALGVLVAHSCFASWNRRFWFMLACVVVPILANGIRAWATIFIAQYVGAEAAGSFDHIVYGWVFFGIVIALVLGVAWRWFEREPEEAGWTASEIVAMSWLRRVENKHVHPGLVLSVVLAVALLFAVPVRLG